MQTVRQMAGERSGIPLLHTPQERPEEWWENVKDAEKAKFVDGDLSEFEEYLANRNL